MTTSARALTDRRTVPATPRSSRPGLRLVEPDEATKPLVDPRVAKHGGYRTDPKAHYEFPGMTDRATCRRTDIHKVSLYFCGFCGKQFGDTHAVYTHLDKRHDR